MTEIEKPVQEKQDETKRDETEGPARGHTKPDWAESEFFKVWLRLAREGQQRRDG